MHLALHTPSELQDSLPATWLCEQQAAAVMLLGDSVPRVQRQAITCPHLLVEKTQDDSVRCHLNVISSHAALFPSRPHVCAPFRPPPQPPLRSSPPFRQLATPPSGSMLGRRCRRGSREGMGEGEGREGREWRGLEEEGRVGAA